MAILQTLRNISREDFDEDLGDATEPENLAEATEVESSLIEAQENEEELNDVEADLDVAEDAMDSMEELISSLEEAVERGGMTPAEARQYNNHRRLIYKNMGEVSSAQRGIATEAFEGVSSRLTMTKVALEEEKGKLKSWWEAIVRFIKAAAAKTIDFITSIFSSVQALQGRAQSILKQANDKEAKAEGKLSKSQKKKYGKLFRMTPDGSVDDISKVTIHINSELKHGSDIKSAIGKIINFEKAINTNNTVQEINDIKPWETKEPDSKAKDALDEKSGKAGDNQSNTYGVLSDCYGGHMLVMKYVKTTFNDDNSSPQAIQDDTVASILFTQVFKVEEKDDKLLEIDNLDLSAIKSEAKNIISFCNQFRTLGEDIKKFNKEFEKVSSKMSNKVTSIGEKAVGVIKAIGNALKRFFTGGNALAKWYKYLISVSKDVLNVLSIRLSNAPGDDEKKEDDKKEEKKDEPAEAAS